MKIDDALSLIREIPDYPKPGIRFQDITPLLAHGEAFIAITEKFATFSPEDNPPEEYYHDFVEILLGCDCTPANPNRPSRQIYEYTYDFVCKHIFYVYPKNVTPTPQYIMEVFLQLIVKENVDGVDIDPFNQLANNYQNFGGRDKYLEWVLSLFS
ncbi:MAG: hypothetical protein ACO3QQ_03280, partial [Candidatus Nanopelagicaceae bacterium]